MALTVPFRRFVSKPGAPVGAVLAATGIAGLRPEIRIPLSWRGIARI
jgi:hypothetical protein